MICTGSEPAVSNPAIFKSNPRVALGISKCQTRINRALLADFWGVGAVLAEVWKRVGVCADSKSWRLAGAGNGAAGRRAGLVSGSDLGSDCPPLWFSQRTFIFIRRALGVCLGRISVFPWNAAACSLGVRSETWRGRRSRRTM